MAEHDDIRARFDERHGGNGLPVHRPLSPVTPRIRYALTDLRLFRLPGLIAGIHHQRELGHDIPLKCCDPQSFHHRVPILDAVAQCARGRVHQDPFVRQTHVGDEDDELFGQVDIHGGAAHHEVIVGHRGCNDGAVVAVFAESQHQPLSLGGVGHRNEELVVHFRLTRSLHDQGQPRALQDRRD